MKRVMLIAVVLTVGVVGLFAGTSHAAKSPSITYHTGVVFTEGMGLYITNDTSKDQEVHIVVRDPVGDLVDTSAVIASFFYHLEPVNCRSGSNCPLRVEITTHSKSVVPSIDNNPVGTVTNEALPAGTFVIG